MADITSIYGNPIKDAVARADIATNTQDISDLKDGLTDLETQITATLITDTASGAIASFPDGAAMPVKSLTVAVEPVQDLHGQANPYPAGGGVNKLPPITAKQSASNGVTFKSNGDGTYSITGTASAGTTLDLTFDTPVSLSTGTYYVSLFNTAASGTIGFYAVGTSRNNLWDTTLGTANRTFTNTNIGNDSITALRCYVASGVTANVTLSPVVAVNAYSTTFAPYENICPISGHTSATVTRTGANVWDEVWELGAVLNSNGQNADSYTDRIRSKNYIPVLPNTQYYVYSGTSAIMYKRFYDANKNYLGSAYSLDTSMNSAFNTPDNAYYMRFNLAPAYGTTYKTDISVNYPATVHEYNAYDGQTVTIDLDGTRYGGTLNVETGVLTVDRKYRLLNGVNGDGVTYDQNGHTAISTRAFVRISDKAYGVNNAIASSFHFVAAGDIVGMMIGRAGNNGIEFYLDPSVPNTADGVKAWFAENPTDLVYELAEPFTVQLTAEEVTTLKGTNNIWNDCGDTTVEYRADTKLYINKMLNA